ncbi:MAG: hypothetical protein R2771_07440 [Saprospiraceae bacterium]
MKQLVFFIILINLAFISCSPKVVNTKESVTIEDKTTEVKVNDESRPTPCVMFTDLVDGEDVMSDFSVYRNLLKSGEYKNAFEYWERAFHKAPGANGKVKYHFDDGVKFYKYFYDNENDPELKLRWIDSVYYIYQKRIECFGDEAYSKGRKAFDYYYYFSDNVNKDTIFNLFAEAVKGQKDHTEYFIINPFSKMLLDRFDKGELDTMEAKLYVNYLTNSIENGLQNCKGQDCESWKIIDDYAPYLLESFESVEDIYPPSYYGGRYFDYYLENPNSCDTIDLVYRKLVWGKVDITDEKYSQLVNDKNTKCYVAPPEPGPLTKAYDCYNEGKYKCAISNFQEFVDKTDDNEKKAKYLILIAKIYYRDLKNFSLSREYALKAASYKANWGEPYMLIGKLYASSGPLCGPGTGWDSQLVTWPAIDKFEYAKKIDSSVAAEANKLIINYEQYMPSKEDIHQRLLKEGQTISVGCWINESTKIRAAKGW